MMPALLMIIACIVISFVFRKNQIRQITGYTCIYLIALTIMQNMDISFTVYFLFIVVSLLPIKRISIFTIIYMLYMFLYLAIGLFYQEFWTTASVFLTRYGFLFIGLLQCSKKYDKNLAECDYMFVIKYGTLTEVLLAIYLLLFGDMENRLAINSQAVGGAISIGVILIISALYFQNSIYWYKYKLYIYAIINLFIIIMSGTRGYMVMAFLTMLPIGMSWVSNPYKYKKRWKLLVVIMLTVSAIILSSKTAQNYVLAIFRINESIGYRVYENDFVEEIFNASIWPNKVFGFGLGGRANEVEGYYAIVLKSASGKDWMVSKLMQETTVHNYWYTILFKQGILGLMLCIITWVIFLVRISWTYKTSKKVCWTLLLLLIGIIISLTFRISATCGIWESILMIDVAHRFAWKKEDTIGGI